MSLRASVGVGERVGTVPLNGRCIRVYPRKYRRSHRHTYAESEGVFLVNSARGTFNTRFNNGEHPTIPNIRTAEARLREARLTNPRVLAHPFTDKDTNENHPQPPQMPCNGLSNRIRGHVSHRGQDSSDRL